MGLLVQLSDDLMDFKRLNADPAAQKITNLIRSFPVVSVLETCSEEEKIVLLRRLQLESQDNQNAEEIFRMIDQFGGTMSLLAEQDFHYFLGLEGLEKAQAQQPAKGQINCPSGWFTLQRKNQSSVPLLFRTSRIVLFQTALFLLICLCARI